MSSDLYDRVHAAMVNWLIGEIRKAAEEGKKDLQIYPEFAYDYYGQRGSVDIVTVEKQEAGYTVEIYELWSAIYRLEEALRKFNEKSSVVPKYIKKSRGDVRKFDLQRNFFVLLHSLQNVELLRDHRSLFNAQFFEANKILSRQEHLVTNQIALIDPLNPQYYPYLFPGDDDIHWQIGRSCLPWVVLNMPSYYPPETEDLLKKWSYLDAKDFWEKWRDKDKRPS